MAARQAAEAGGAVEADGAGWHGAVGGVARGRVAQAADDPRPETRLERGEDGREVPRPARIDRKRSWTWHRPTTGVPRRHEGRYRSRSFVLNQGGYDRGMTRSYAPTAGHRCALARGLPGRQTGAARSSRSTWTRPASSGIARSPRGRSRSQLMRRWYVGTGRPEAAKARERRIRGGVVSRRGLPARVGRATVALSLRAYPGAWEAIDQSARPAPYAGLPASSGRACWPGVSGPHRVC